MIYLIQVLWFTCKYLTAPWLEYGDSEEDYTVDFWDVHSFVEVTESLWLFLDEGAAVGSFAWHLAGWRILRLPQWFDLRSSVTSIVSWVEWSRGVEVWFVAFSKSINFDTDSSSNRHSLDASVRVKTKEAFFKVWCTSKITLRMWLLGSMMMMAALLSWSTWLHTRPTIVLSHWEIVWQCNSKMEYAEEWCFTKDHSMSTQLLDQENQYMT